MGLSADSYLPPCRTYSLIKTHTTSLIGTIIPPPRHNITSRLSHKPRPLRTQSQHNISNNTMGAQ